MVQRATAENIRLLHALKADLGPLSAAQTPSQVYRTLEPYPASILLVAYVATGDRLVRELIRRFVHEWRDVKPTTTGRDLKTMGLRPGPRYSDILEELLYARLDGRVVSDEEELAYLEQLVGELR